MNSPAMTADRIEPVHSDPLDAGPRSRRGQPVWEIASFYPAQGDWTEEDYLALDTNRLIEFHSGTLEFLPMTYPLHQDIAQFLFLELHRYAAAHGCGRADFAALRTRTIPGCIREPDVLLVSRAQIEDPRKPVLGAELVMEVLSDRRDDRDRDLIVKRNEYAAAAIPEYWIIDPQARTIQVLGLDREKSYEVVGLFGEGRIAASRLLSGFAIDVAACFRAGELPAADSSPAR